MATERTWVIPTDAGGEVVDRQQAHALLADLEATLFRVGGRAMITADRQAYAQAGGETLYRTIGYVVQWQAFAPARPAASESEVQEDLELAGAGATES